MPNDFQGRARVGAVALVLAALAGQNAAAAGETKWNHFGRWTVDDPTDKFSANGRLYRVIDIAPCGKDFCGVSVEGGACGATLFRFFSTHGKDDALTGHGKWGADQKKLFVAVGVDAPTMTISLGGPTFDPESRSGSVPTFTADYHRIGDAQCKADAPGV
jgi:hypothetical protein